MNGEREPEDSRRKRSALSSEERRALIARDWKNYRNGITAGAVLLVVLWLLGKGVCPVSNLAGVPCPGCGMTRSIVLLLAGRWKESMQMQPFAGLWLLFGAACLWERYYLGKNGKWKWAVLIPLLAGMLAYYIRQMAVVFPGSPPYNYIEGNLLERTLPGYGQWVKQFMDG